MNIYLPEPLEIADSAKKLLKDTGHTLFTHTLSESERGNMKALFIRTYTHANAAYLMQFPKLTYILRCGVGLDNIDVAYCKENDITIFNSPGANALSVAEYVLAMMIFSLRNIALHQRNLQNGEWRDRGKMGYELKGKVIGFIGCGAIVRALIPRLTACEVSGFVGYDPYLTDEQLSALSIEKKTLTEVLSLADVVSLHLPLTDETKNLIDTEKLSLMKNSAYLINTSRGGIVDENALIEAIKTGVISGAVLDVFESEPSVKKELLNIPEIICTPHIAGFTHEADEQMSLAPVTAFLNAIAVTA